MQITITDQFKDLARPEVQEVTDDLRNELYDEEDTAVEITDFNSNQQIQKFTKQAHKTIDKVKNKMPNFSVLKDKFPQDLTVFKNTYQTVQQQNQINNMKQTIEGIAVMVADKSADDLSAYKDTQFACGEGTLANLQMILANMTLVPSYNNLAAQAKGELVDQLLLSYMNTLKKNENNLDTVGFGFYISEMMEIHNVASLRNLVADDYKVKYTSIEEDIYVKDYNDTTKFSADEKNTLKTFVTSYLDNELQKEEILVQYAEKIAGKIQERFPESLQNLGEEGIQEAIKVEGIPLKPTMFYKMSDEDGQWSVKEGMVDILNAAVTKQLQDSNLMQGAVVKFGENMEIIRSENKFVAKDTAGGYEVLKQFNVNSLAEANEVADVLQALAGYFEAIKTAVIEKMSAAKQAKNQDEINTYTTLKTDAKLVSLIEAIDNFMTQQRNAYDTLPEDKKPEKFNFHLHKSFKVQQNQGFKNAKNKLPETVQAYITNLGLWKESQLLRNFLEERIKSKIEELSVVTEQQYLQEQFTQDLLKETYNKLLDDKELDENIKQQVKDHLETADLQEFSISKFNALTSDNAIALYEAGVEGLNFDSLKELDIDKIIGLTSDNAIKAYKAGPTFADLSIVYSNNKAKFNALTSDNAMELYEAGVKFAELSEIYDSHGYKFDCLTSDNAMELYRAGVKFAELSEIYDSHGYKFDCLTSHDAIKAIKDQELPDITFNALKDLGDDDKIEALTSDDAIKAYKAGVKFAELSKIYSNEDKFNALTSDNAIKAYKAGPTFADLSIVYDDNEDKFNALTSDNATNAYRSGVKFNELSSLYDNARKVADKVFAKNNNLDNTEVKKDKELIANHLLSLCRNANLLKDVQKACQQATTTDNTGSFGHMARCRTIPKNIAKTIFNNCTNYTGIILRNNIKINKAKLDRLNIDTIKRLNQVGRSL